MAATGMLTSNNLAVKKWELETQIQMYQYTAYGLLDSLGAIYYPDGIGKGNVGDQTTFAYAGKLTAVPIGEGGILAGNAEALDLTSHAMKINVSRFGVQSPQKQTIEQTRTNVDFDAVGAKQITRRGMELLDTSVMYQAAGCNPTSLTINGTTYSNTTDLLHVQGHNAPVSPTSERIVRAGGASADENLTPSNTMRLDWVDAAIEQAQLSAQPIEMFDDGTFVLIISPEQATDLIRDSVGKVQWYANQLAARQAGGANQLEDRFVKKGGMNMQFLGRYGNVNIYSAPRVAYGVNSSTSAVITTVRRAVLLGRDALSFASPFGKSIMGENGSIIRMFEQEFDHGYQLSREGRMIYGVKKMSPTNKQDIGVIVISTYAAPHNS